MRTRQNTKIWILITLLLFFTGIAFAAAPILLTKLQINSAADNTQVILSLSDNPRYKIFTYSMSPAHMSPHVAKRIVLIKQMIFAIKINKTVGIVCPVYSRGKMKLRPRLLKMQSIGFWPKAIAQPIFQTIKKILPGPMK